MLNIHGSALKAVDYHMFFLNFVLVCIRNLEHGTLNIELFLLRQIPVQHEPDYF